MEAFQQTSEAGSTELAAALVKVSELDNSTMQKETMQMMQSIQQQ